MATSNTTLAVISANVILTFEEGPQCIYDASAIIPIAGITPDDYETIEIDVIDQFLSQAEARQDRLDQLIKISLCYDGRRALGGRELSTKLADKADDIIEFLIRNKAKYYFQPNQRDDYEQRIVDRTGVASRTRDFA